MTDVRRTVAYEVYVMRQTRWELHARFGPDERSEAVSQGKSLNGAAGVQAVKVIREVFDSFAEITEEYVVYKSRRDAPAPIEITGRRRRRTVPKRKKRPNDFETAGGGAIDPKLAIRIRVKMAAKAIFSTFMALAAAVLITAVFTQLFSGFGRFQAKDLSSVEISSLVAIFCGVFLAVAVIAAGQLFPALEKYMKASFAESLIVRGIRRARSATPPRPSGLGGGLAPSQSPAQTAPAGDTAAQTDVLKAYLRDAVQPVRGAYDVRDQYIRFGINLFTAGACEALCKERDIGQDAAQRVLTDVVRALGVPEDKAGTFAANHTEYLVSNPRYTAMFDAGRDAMQTYLSGQPQASDMLCRALDNWVATKATPAAPSGSVTVMFTEIPDYDEIVARDGDAAGQQRLRIHNGIVEAALQEFAGTRIKQMQNGAMASFTDCAHGVDAAIAIRDRLDAHTRGNPAQPVTARIGLNCGDPITEDDDLFGSTVQLAARITAEAASGQVLVSQAVRDGVMARTTTVTFPPKGTPILKGFASPVPLFAAEAAAPNRIPEAKEAVNSF